MNDTDRLAEALERIDRANRDDPRTRNVDGIEEPREWVFSRRVFDWVCRLVPGASEALRLAARAHTLRRWEIARASYPKTNVGYHLWRAALADFHAVQATRILEGVGYGQDLVRRVRALILKENWRADPEGRALEDADCLAFLELKLTDCLNEWGDEKTVDILKKTLRKMTPAAIELAAGLSLGPRITDLVNKTGE